MQRPVPETLLQINETTRRRVGKARHSGDNITNSISQKPTDIPYFPYRNSCVAGIVKYLSLMDTALLRFRLSCIFLVMAQVAMAQTGVGAKCPKGATVFFDGSSNMLHAKWTYWNGPRLGASLPIKWAIQPDPVDKGTVVNTNDPASAGGLYGAADIVTKQEFRDFRAHVEFLIVKPGGNSGVYLQNRYEIQVLDGDSTSHGMGAIINESNSPYAAYNGVGKWNAYDVVFRAARFKDGKLVEPAMVTLYFNGVKAHTNFKISQVWGGAKSGLDGGNNGGKGITDRPGGLKLQAEGHDVLYRNIWIQELELKEANTDF